MDKTWITPIATALITLFGLAVNWGAFKTRLDNHDRQLDHLEDGQLRQDGQLTSHGNSIARLEGKLGHESSY